LSGQSYLTEFILNLLSAPISSKLAGLMKRQPWRIAAINNLNPSTK
jgi:hypothetical protein